MPNALANESSPYLLQHKDNPVNWYPWGDKAIELSREQQKPIFLSIGYSACHWCHVMEHESFENEGLADYLNKHFISIKVDREERPDLDQIYMNAVQTMTGRGGWPMSVFLTPDLKPFYGGTYWPPTAGRGMPGFDQVLAAVNDAWQNRREQALETADQLTGRLEQLTQVAEHQPPLDHSLILEAAKQLESSFDPTHGGFGSAPKFLHTMDMELLLRLWKSDKRSAWIDMVRHTLDRMAAGGIYDHLGGGFARYSVDAEWLVPHFEKMLYDNALLAKLLVDLFAALPESDSFKQEAARIARETLDYVLRDMTHSEGSFYSTEDADSLPYDDPEGHAEEGLFYTWKSEEIRKIIGEEDSDLFCGVYGLSPIGNFEGRNILHLSKSIEANAKQLGFDPVVLDNKLEQCRKKLFEARTSRPRPGLDDKVITCWNGLMIDAMAKAGVVLEDTRYLAAAERAADFLLTKMRDSQGRLQHTWRNGVAKIDGFLDDYAALANSLITLYESTFNEAHLDSAAELLDTLLEKFNDDTSGGFFYAEDPEGELIVRNKELTDNATPGGNSLAATALERLGSLLGENRYLEAADRTLQATASWMQRAPGAMGQMLCSLDRHLGPSYELVFVGEGAADLLSEIRRCYLPRTVLVGPRKGDHQSERLKPILQGKVAINGQPTLYLCEGSQCREPIVGASAIREALLTL